MPTSTSTDSGAPEPIEVPIEVPVVLSPKETFLNKIESQDWILTEAQKAKVKFFLADHQITKADVPTIKRILDANDIKLEKAAQWYRNQQDLEDTTKRERNYKTYQHPEDPTKRIMVSQKNIHVFDGTEYIDKPDLSFPDGLVLPSGKRNHVVMTLPDWAKVVKSDTANEVLVYDQEDELVMTYTLPMVTLNGEHPYTIKDENGDFVKYTSKLKCNWSIGETVETNPNAEEATFIVNGQQVGFNISAKASGFELQAWDDTTAGTLNQDCFFYSGNPTTNYNSDVLQTGHTGSNKRRWVMQMTMPSDPGGTVDDVDVTLTTNYVSGGMTLDLHELTQTGWVDSQVTWNNYSTGNAWATAGGDYSGTVIDSLLTSVDETEYTLGLMGTNATNPLTIDWGDSVHFLGKSTLESGGNKLAYYDSSTSPASPDSATFLITYTAGGGATNEVKSIAGISNV